MSLHIQVSLVEVFCLVFFLIIIIFKKISLLKMLMIVNVLSACLLGMLPDGTVGNSDVSLLQCCRAVELCTQVCSVCTC